MEKLQQIRWFILIGIFILKLEGLNAQCRISIEINDSVNTVLNIDSKVRKIVMGLNGSNIVKTTFWPNGKVGSVICRINDSSALKLGFNYIGVLISQSEYKTLGDSLIPNGIHYHYSDEGVLSHIYTYRNGLLDGQYRSYYEDGMIEVVGTYLKGEKTGIWKYYSPNGQLRKKG